MSDITITFKPSLDKLAAAFDMDLDSSLREKISEFAFMVERESKRVTPVKTGRLRASIGVDLGTGLSAIISPDTDYAYFVHEGTRRMDGRPFMAMGAEAAGETFEDKVAEDLEKHIQDKLP